MAFNPFGFVLGSLQAQREGVNDPQARTRLGFIGGLFGSPVTGLALTTVLARREAEAESASDQVPPTSRLIEIPAVTGLGTTEAQQEIQALGLRVQLRDAQSSTTRKGFVISQDPPAGTAVQAGSTVTLTVSQGFLLPDVGGQPAEAAKTQLENLGLQVSQKDQRSTTVPKGSVISQDPPAGATVSKNDTVTLTISQGSNVEVPDVKGKRFTDAEKQLHQDLGFEVRRVDQNSEAVNPDFVISQDPPAGTSIPAGSQVTLTVSRGQVVTMPDVTNKRFAEAEKQLKDLVPNLAPKRVDQSSDAVKQDFVISQAPPVGTPISADSEVTLAVSKGSQEAALVDLPDLTGRKFRGAREKLQDLDFDVGRENVDSDKPKDQVVDQNPKPGKVARESLVTLFVSKGPKQVEQKGDDRKRETPSPR